MKFCHISFFGLGFSLVFVLSPRVWGQSLSVDARVREVAAYLTGAMDTSAQAAIDRRAPDVRITTCPVRVADTADIFLYQEQALSLKLNSPYRQRFLQIAPSSDNLQVESITYKPANPEAWVGLCDKPEVDRTVSVPQLGETICSVTLQRDGEGYLGTTPEEGCAANYRGAVRITNQVQLTRSTMETWDRGFDAAGKQVWGAEDESYQYRDIDPKVQDPEVNAVAQFFNGAFDNSAQVAEDETFLPVRFNNCPAIVTDSPFPETTPILVSEQASNAPTLQFASQRLVQIRRSADGARIELASYKLEGEGWADFCDRPPEDRLVAAEAIGNAECTIVFTPDGDEGFIGSTPPGGCSSNFRGSAAVTIDARFSRDGLEMWERWFDGSGNQVAGSQTGAYLYRPIDEAS
ncbi:MAG: CpcT/CpeT family chromophore lyase [Geitlerinemataceae cyanobacterium]